jgi:hypothetical protein
MKKLSSIALAAIVIVLATTAPGHADGRRGVAGFAGHPSSRQFHGHSGFSGHRGFDGRRFHGRRFDGRFHSRTFIVAPFIAAPFLLPYAYPPAYAPPALTYWYCPSYGAYYPQVQSCPEQWVPVTGY